MSEVRRVTRAEQRRAEDELIERMAGFSLDPLGFVRFAFPWGEAGTPLAGLSGPRQWQAELLGRLGERLVAQRLSGVFAPIQIARASGHGVGKSTVVAWLVLWGLATMPMARVMATANTEPQLRTKTWPEVQKWLGMLICRHWFVATATKIESVDAERASGWRADALPWSSENTEAFAGLHNQGRRIVVAFDEGSAIDNIIWEVAEGALTDADTEIIWAVFGNPTRTEGRFRDCFGRFAHRWDHRAIDSRTVEGTNKDLFAKWVEDWGEDSDFVRVRVRGMFPRSGISQFIPTDLAEDAASARREVYRDRSAPLAMGVDVARGGDAQSVIRFRRARDARSIAPVKLRTRDTVQVAARVAEQAHLHRADAIFIDGGGVGGGVVDAARRMTKIPVVEVWFGGKADRAVLQELGAARNVYANKRAEMWGNMRDWLPGGAIDNDPELIGDMVGIEFGYVMRDGRDAIQLSPKEMSGRTCDDGDALALTFAYPVVPRGDAGTVGGSHQSEYNPYKGMWSTFGREGAI